MELLHVIALSSCSRLTQGHELRSTTNVALNHPSIKGTLDYFDRTIKTISKRWSPYPARAKFTQKLGPLIVKIASGHVRRVLPTAVPWRT